MKKNDRSAEVAIMKMVDGAAQATRVLSWVVMLGIVAVSAFAPHLALAQAAGGGLNGLCTQANNAIGWIQTGVYFILVVAVLGSGVAAAFGRMEWATVGRILIGCIVAGLATALVGALYGNGGC